MLAVVAVASPVHDHGQRPDKSRQSITDSAITWPTAEQFRRVLGLRDYNTRIVVFGVSCLGMAAGTIGTFLLLRKRSLTADALSHATLPGIALAFILSVALGGEGKELYLLLSGAFVLGIVAVGVILLIRNTTRIKDDAVLGIVLSVFFGLGMALLKIAEQMPGGSAAGLNSFVIGRAASMIAADAKAILAIGVLIVITCVVMFKEFRLLCFDQSFARSQGWPVLMLDWLLMGLVVAVTVIGLQAVGLVLIIAILITPAAAARFWTERLEVMVVLAGLIGGISGLIGAIASALIPRMPTGPIIVVVCAAIFVVSMIIGRQRGVLVRAWRHVSLARRVGMQNLMRSMFELCEAGDPAAVVIAVRGEELLRHRSWSAPSLRRQIRTALRRGLLRQRSDGKYLLTEAGMTDAKRVVRNHRLWEVYLITHADIAPSHVDRDADQIEHVLKPQMIEQLEQLLSDRFPQAALPYSPHSIGKLPPGNPAG